MEKEILRLKEKLDDVSIYFIHLIFMLFCLFKLPIAFFFRTSLPSLFLILYFVFFNKRKGAKPYKLKNLNELWSQNLMIMTNGKYDFNI